MLTIDEIRHANLLLLIKEYGSIQKLAVAVERSHSQISQLKNRSKHSGSQEPRQIGDEVARHLEEKTGKVRGWMDVSHEPAHLVGEEPPRYEPDPGLDVRAVLRYATPEDRARLYDALRMQVVRSRAKHLPGEFERLLDQIDRLDESLPKH